MARDSDTFEPEREQTLKLVRAFLQYNGVIYISQNIVRAVVAIAEQTDCRLRNICLETIAELGKRKPKTSMKRHLLTFFLYVYSYS
jgi:hypothetical protein